MKSSLLFVYWIWLQVSGFLFGRFILFQVNFFFYFRVVEFILCHTESAKSHVKLNVEYIVCVYRFLFYISNILVDFSSVQSVIVFHFQIYIFRMELTLNCYFLYYFFYCLCFVRVFFEFIRISKWNVRLQDICKHWHGKQENYNRISVF